MFCNLLIKYKSSTNSGRTLTLVVRKRDVKLLRTFFKAGADLEMGEEALVEAAEEGLISLAIELIHLGVDIDTPKLPTSPLRTAIFWGQQSMADFLVTHGADINMPAAPDGGRTPLQEALSCEYLESAWLLLSKGADIFAPPAFSGGLTALEAICHNFMGSIEEILALCNYLLDENAPVNRPNGEPSSAIHGTIDRGWDRILLRMLEPERKAVINLMWCDKSIDEDDMEGGKWRPRAPIQLAAEYSRLEFVKILLDRGADVNEDPGYRFGRTALQAATSEDEPNIELVEFLLEKGADINARPATYGGLTALQGAAIRGDLFLAKLLIEKGAQVNADAAYMEGRYAIEGAAENGRLDMVQFLLNAGAVGNTRNGTGLQEAINLAEKNEHFAVANLLKEAMAAKIPNGSGGLTV